ncbi:hypothetical protein [Limimaricola hongkongensis]|uniref:Excalibur calcium-binding domain-containing protein n=1 Tax=Limimaricola hongkongensis DSM 17492 TaxID=1122180 RepID=A0A017HDX2_9RHOB|nr:hypothetical protein [Limimaricola hongkongensis]EYD72712.1 hypothetical protein Lokhon_01515 [Limimaricola hongkongensis DSM 17492]
MKPIVFRTKFAALAGAAMALSACAAQLPDSGEAAARAAREAQLTGQFGGQPGAQSGGQPVAPGAISSTDLAAAGIDVERRGGVQASPANAAPSAADPSGAAISDEQSFEAVANRETIESDAARRAEQAAAYQVIQPTALPQRAGDTGPNIVEYALNAPNRRGQEWYSRFILGTMGNRFERNCAAYRSPDEAQRDFLARGGPERDPKGIDPDGDGFACGWDPAPFLAAVGR